MKTRPASALRPAAPPGAPRPFLKWAGGKTQLLGRFASLYPREFEGYHEPFVGSAAVFFHLHALRQSRRLRGAMKRVRLTDSNAELVNCYRMVRDDVHGLIALLAGHKKAHGAEHYYAVRGQSPAALTALERAARLIYLNKTCYNGLYRVNRRGQFNVPMGRYKNPGIFAADDLLAASRALRGVEVEVAGFREAARQARPGDFIYFDPPYDPVTRTARFTSYTANAFGEQQQRELAEVFRRLDGQGCQVMLSNSNTPFVLGLYEGFTLIEVEAARAINSRPDRRGKVSELVVLNYRP